MKNGFLNVGTVLVRYINDVGLFDADRHRYEYEMIMTGDRVVVVEATKVSELMFLVKLLTKTGFVCEAFVSTNDIFWEVAKATADDNS